MTTNSELRIILKNFGGSVVRGEDNIDQAIAKIEDLYEVNLDTLREHDNACIIRIHDLETALREIWQEAGNPTMAYSRGVEFVERGRIIYKIIDIAKKALGGGSR